MESVEEVELHDCVKSLSEKAINIQEKIKSQDYIIESIQVNAEGNQQELRNNESIFYSSMDKLNKDKRNTVILFLLFIVAILLCIIKTS